MFQSTVHIPINVGTAPFISGDRKTHDYVVRYAVFILIYISFPCFLICHQPKAVFSFRKINLIQKHVLQVICPISQGESKYRNTL